MQFNFSPFFRYEYFKHNISLQHNEQRTLYTWSVFDDNDFLSNKQNVEELYKELQISNDSVTSEDIPENILKSAAEMMVYLSFRPSNTTIYLMKMVQTNNLQVKNIIMGKGRVQIKKKELIEFSIKNLTHPPLIEKNNK